MQNAENYDDAKRKLKKKKQSIPCFSALRLEHLMSNSNILLSNSKPCRLHSSAMTERIRHKITHVRTGCQHVIDDVYLTSHGGEPVTALFAHVHIHILCLNRSKLCNLYFIVGGRLHLGVIGEPLALVQPIEASVNVFAALTFDT